MRIQHFGLAVISAVIVVVVAQSIQHARSQAVSSTNNPALNELEQRPLRLPSLSPNQPCPLSHGSKSSVTAYNAFCATCYWFGKGPVFLALAWSDQKTDEARFALQKIPYEQNAFRAKTPWVSKPDYSGPILVRGRRIDGDQSDYLQFGGGGEKAARELILQAPAAGRTDSRHWSFWPTSMFVPRPGCYALQIDTPNDSDVVVFKATPQ